MVSIVVETPALVTRHPRMPGVELHRGVRAGEFYLLAVGVRLSGEQLVDVGSWLTERGREQTAITER